MEKFKHNNQEYCIEDCRLGGNYRTIILLTHNGANFRQDENTFVDYMSDLLHLATDKYCNLVKEEIEQCFANRRTDALKYAIKFAERKWKTEKKRQEYVDTKMAEYDEQQLKVKHKFPNNLIFFDFWPGPHHGMPGVCSGLAVDTSDETLHCAWKHLHNNEWFNKGFGLVFKYETRKDSYLYSSRPWIEVIMSEEDKAAAEAGQKAIDDDISAFYANSRYCGD